MPCRSYYCDKKSNMNTFEHVPNEMSAPPWPFSASSNSSNNLKFLAIKRDMEKSEFCVRNGCTKQISLYRNENSAAL